VKPRPASPALAAQMAALYGWKDALPTALAAALLSRD